jgi:hypothetical protein
MFGMQHLVNRLHQKIQINFQLQKKPQNLIQGHPLTPLRGKTMFSFHGSSVIRHPAPLMRLLIPRSDESKLTTATDYFIGHPTSVILLYSLFKLFTGFTMAAAIA